MTERINTGGPAFPVPLNQGQSYQGHAPCDGMTLRDYFAAAALTGFLHNAEHHKFVDVPQVAAGAYKMADAMIAAREGGAS